MVDRAGGQFGRLDILVNNAGIIRDRTLKDLSPADWQDVIDTNLTGVFHCCQAAATRLSDGGRIVSLASVSGLRMNLARQVGVRLGMPVETTAFTVNMMCASGMKAVLLADQAIRAGEARCVGGRNPCSTPRTSCRDRLREKGWAT